MHYLIILLSLFNIPNNQTYNEKNPIIYLERTICYGTCPAYRIEIYNDETGWYDGKRFVKRIGKIPFSVKKQDISNIIQKAEELNFFDMKNEYTERVSDLPTTYIKIKNKKIIDYYGAPKELKNLEKFIDDIVLKNLKWKSYLETTP